MCVCVYVCDFAKGLEGEESVPNPVYLCVAVYVCLRVCVCVCSCVFAFACDFAQGEGADGNA